MADVAIYTLQPLVGQTVSRHFGPKTLRHWCRSVWTLRHWCRNVRKTLRYRSVFGVVCAIVCCDITIASRIGLAWRLRTRRNRFNAVYLKHDGTAIDWADRTASASQSLFTVHSVRCIYDVSSLSPLLYRVCENSLL